MDNFENLDEILDEMTDMDEIELENDLIDPTEGGEEDFDELCE
ncbi:MAG: hypothetical protein ACRCVN_00150 [Spirochaetia bacterium]